MKICKIIDLHMHVVPNIDDGAVTIEESLQMLKMAQKQGVSDVFCTSHNGYSKEDGKKYDKLFELLKKRVQIEGVDIKLHKGCEILTAIEYVDDILYGIEIGAFSKLGDTEYVLIEFYPDTKPSEATKIVQKMLENGYKPIIAHMERNENITDIMVGLLIRMGALIQVNAFSFEEESNNEIKQRARNLLQQGYIHFIGSDAHRLTHRPPDYLAGIEYILTHIDKKNAKNILYNNAKKLLLGGNHDKQN